MTRKVILQRTAANHAKGNLRAARSHQHKSLGFRWPWQTKDQASEEDGDNGTNNGSQIDEEIAALRRDARLDPDDPCSEVTFGGATLSSWEGAPEPGSPNELLT